MEFDLNAPEVQQAIKDAVDKEVQGLKAKNSELLAKVSSGKATAEELAKAQEALKEIEDAKLKDEANWQELEGRLRAEMNEKESVLKSTNESLTNTIIGERLTSELLAAGVAPHFLEAVKAMLRSQVALEENKAVAEGQPLNEYIKAWAESDTGKHFVAAPDNSGGGAPGSKNSKPVSKKFNEMSSQELTELHRTDPAQYNKLKDEYHSSKQ